MYSNQCQNKWPKSRQNLQDFAFDGSKRMKSAVIIQWLIQLSVIQRAFLHSIIWAFASHASVVRSETKGKEESRKQCFHENKSFRQKKSLFAKPSSHSQDKQLVLNHRYPQTKAIAALKGKNPDIFRSNPAIRLRKTSVELQKGQGGLCSSF